LCPRTVGWLAGISAPGVVVTERRGQARHYCFGLAAGWTPDLGAEGSLRALPAPDAAGQASGDLRPCSERAPARRAW